MPFTKSPNPAGGVDFKLMVGSSQTEEFGVIFEGSVGAWIGRGTTDTDITYLKLKNADGEVAYIFPNATQDGITVQATRP